MYNSIFSDDMESFILRIIGTASGIPSDCLFKLVGDKFKEKYCLQKFLENESLQQNPLSQVTVQNFSGDNVVFEYGKKDNYELWSFSIESKNLEKIKVVKDGKELKNFLKKTFIDISPSHPLHDIIYNAVQNKWLTGYPDNTIRLSSPVNRAEFAKMLLLAFQKGTANPQNIDHYPDVETEAWYAPYLSRATELHLMSGYPDRTMRPGNTINMAEAMKMIVQILDFPKKESRLMSYPSQPWYAKYEEFLHYLLNRKCLAGACGFDTVLGGLAYESSMTRADCIALIAKVLEEQGED